MTRRAVLASGCFAALGLTALLAWSGALPDLEIRCSPRQTNAGRIFPGHALGQGFRCEFDGLHAIDVAVTPLGGTSASDIELTLHVRDVNGPVLRRAKLAAAQLPRSDDWARFEFDTVPDSSNVAFWFELSSSVPSSHGPWVRYRGVPYLVRPWGAKVFDEREQSGELRAQRPDVLLADLEALAFAADGLDGAAGAATLTLRDATTNETLRTSTLAPRAPIASGWAFFAFEPLLDSRWRALRYELTLPAGSRLVGTDQGHSIIAFHAAGTLATSALGATCAGAPLPDRDLVFRAWSDGRTAGFVSRLKSRGGARLLVAGLLWTCAFAALTPLIRSLRNRSD